MDIALYDSAVDAGTRSTALIAIKPSALLESTPRSEVRLLSLQASSRSHLQSDHW
jgi:hypothetical protein